jgi:small subunit ribosomal protein S30e
MGKVHGSLARAGKVRSQTPKVEKLKKTGKKKTGRAHKRYIYNKRYGSIKAGQDPLRQKLNSIQGQQAIKAFKEQQQEKIAAKK